MEWDVFISYASEDRAAVATPLAVRLRDAGVSVWLDENELKLGDSLRSKIDLGLSRSRYGIVVLSKAFFAKDWPQRELNGLIARERIDHKVVLPIWHGIDRDFIAQYSPILADKLAANTSQGLDSIVSSVLSVVKAEQKTQGGVENKIRFKRRKLLIALVAGALTMGTATALWYGAGLRARFLGQPPTSQELIATYKAAIERSPHEAEPYYQLGRTLRESGQPRAAIDYFSKAITLRPNWSEAMNERGAAERDVGETAKALVDFNQALKNNPRNSDALSNRGTIREQQGDLAGALQDFTDALAIAPHDGVAFYNRGLAYRRANNVEQAAGDFEQALTYARSDDLRAACRHQLESLPIKTRYLLQRTLSRSSYPDAYSVVIPVSQRRAEFELDLGPGEERHDLRVEIRKADASAVLWKTTVKAVPGSAPVFAIPGNVLNAGDYLCRVFDSANEPVAEYLFRVK